MMHINAMIEDQYDYYLYSLRKFTLLAFEGLLKITNNELYSFGYIQKAAIGLCKLALKVKKLNQEDKDAYAKEFEEYKQSDEWKAVIKMKETAVEDDDDEDYKKKDWDPKGY